MMDKEILNKGELMIKLEGSQIKLEYVGKGGGAAMYAELDYFLDLLMEAIPGEVDDTIINMLKGAFLS
jgi:hypothetical protein